MFLKSFPKSLVNFEKIKIFFGKMDNTIFGEGSVANDEGIAEAIEENIKNEVYNVQANIEDLKSSEVVDSTKNESTIEEPTTVLDSNKTESNTEAGRYNPELDNVEEIRKDLHQEERKAWLKAVRKFRPYRNKVRPHRNKVRIPKDKSELEEVSRVFFGFPNTEGLAEEEARSAILDYWNNQGGKAKELIDKTYIPKDTSRYPGFPNIKCLPKEEVDEAVKNFWTQWNEKKTVFPEGFWKEPTALMPKDKSQYPDFPCIEGLSKEEADLSIIEFWNKFKEKEDQLKTDGIRTINVRKMQFRQKFKKLVEKGIFYDKYREAVLTLGSLPPQNSSFYDKFGEFVMPKTEGMTEKEVEKNIIQHWNSWNEPKTQIEKTEEKNQREKRLEFLKAKKETKKQERNLLQENKTLFPEGFWNEPTALIPKDPSQFPDFPNIDGLPKEEADNSIIEFWKKIKEKNYGYLVLKQVKKVLPTAQDKRKTENRKTNEKNQGNRGNNDRNQGRKDRNQGRHDRDQGPFAWGQGVWNQDSGNSWNSSQDFGGGFGRNPDWLQQQPSGYSRSSSQDTGYNSLPNAYGDYNSYDNYNKSSSGSYYNQPGFAQDYSDQGYNQNYSNQEYGNQLSHDDYYQQFDGRQSNKRTQNPMMPDRAQSAKKCKPTVLPKPAQNSAKILAQLKNCPFGVSVYQSQSTKYPITKKEFTEIMAVINQKWIEQSGFGENLRIEGSEWHKDRGIILCQDEFSRKWIQASVDEITIGGRFFKAWSTGDVIDVSVILGPALDKCPDPRVVISKALENAEISASNIEVVNVTSSNEGRQVDVLLDRKTVKAVRAKNGRIFAGLTQLNFRIDYHAEGGE